MNKKELVREMLKAIGENPDREGLNGTPDRVVRIWNEIFGSCKYQLLPKVTKFKNGSDGIIYNQMITDTGDFYSHCEHHMVPFFGTYCSSYSPHETGELVGLSKVARVVNYFSSRLQIQERLTHQIVDYIWKELCNINTCKNKPYSF